jgi:hypothetical protein
MKQLRLKQPRAHLARRSSPARAALGSELCSVCAPRPTRVGDEHQRRSRGADTAQRKREAA